jgi:hypothetical protein
MTEQKQSWCHTLGSVSELKAEHWLKLYKYNLFYDAIVQAIHKAVDPPCSIELFGITLSGH